MKTSAWSDKMLWIKRYFGETFYKKLIITHHKELNIGDYLIDDRDRNGYQLDSINEQSAEQILADIALVT